MAPPIALFGGHLFNRALDNWGARASRWETVTLVAAGATTYWLLEFRDTTAAVIWAPVIALATGLLLKLAQVRKAGCLPRPAAAAFLLAPLVIVQFGLFYNGGWYYRGSSPSGLAAFGERALEHLNSGLAARHGRASRPDRGGLGARPGLLAQGLLLHARYAGRGARTQAAALRISAGDRHLEGQ
jgi:hypothetical protein